MFSPFRLYAFSALFIISFAVTTSLYAQSGGSVTETGGGSGGSVTETGGAGASAPIPLPNPLKGDTTNIPQLIGNTIQRILGVIGAVALAMFVYGGLLWMTAAGNDKKVQQGKDVLIWATLGILLIFFSYTIISFLFYAVGAENAADQSGGQTQNQAQ